MSEEVKEMGHTAARITGISQNGRVWVTRKYPKTGLFRLQAVIGTRLYVNDRIKTEEGTFAKFEFWTGGQIGLNKNTEIEIVGINRAETINMSFFDKIKHRNKQNDPLQIRTSSGGGIKG